ncbi:MAG: hypothetical protein AAF849_13165 [Bacteroidota bacterium]
MDTKFEDNQETFVTEIKSLEAFFENGVNTKNCTFQGIDFTEVQINWDMLDLEHCCFLGCKLRVKDQLRLIEKGAHVLNTPDNLPYQPFRNQLYTCTELMKGFSEEKDHSEDLKIYRHFSKYRFNPPVGEALWQRIHDHSIDEALRDLLQFDENGMTKRKCVGFMGGHSTKRSDPYFRKMAITAKLMAEAGYLVVSGGGPGIMEAANLGAYFAGRSLVELEDAINILCEAPHYTAISYHQKAMEVIQKYPNGTESLAIPTWFYGHEPSNLFSTHIAKYFSNSIREDTLLAVCLYGIVYAPGSAGTTQEVFQEATQNHYGTFNYYSPMVFLGEERYQIQTLIYPLLKQLAWGKEYYDLLHLTDDPEEIVQFIQQHPPVKKS